MAEDFSFKPGDQKELTHFSDTERKVRHPWILFPLKVYLRNEGEIDAFSDKGKPKKKKKSLADLSLKIGWKKFFKPKRSKTNGKI